MITSGQVSQMHMMAMQQHGMAPGRSMAAQPMMGMSQYPPTFSYSMAGAQNPNEQMSNRMVGAGLGAAGEVAVNVAAGGVSDPESPQASPRLVNTTSAAKTASFCGRQPYIPNTSLGR